MANGLSMKVLLQLQKQQFDAGIKQVKSSIAGLARSIKSMAGMIVGGLGMSQLVSQFRTAAKNMSVMRATMENVSNGYKEYADNMKFIQRISNDYGQDMVSLGNGFAKFRAAAKTTNLSLEEQRYIFESLTRAAGAYHLSAEQTSNVMLAVEQMLSKGKVTAEELRRQLGNSLPGAFQLMAQAAGVSTAELDSLMKSGKIISQDVLPKFAQVLNATTSAANFDSLQSSLNRFKNSWNSFVDKSGFENVFKTLVDVGTNGLNVLSNNVQRFGRIVISVFSGSIAYAAVNMFKRFKEESQKNVPMVIQDFERLRSKIKNNKNDLKELTEYSKALSRVQSKNVGTVVRKEDLEFLKGVTKEQKKIIANQVTQNGYVYLVQKKEDAVAMVNERINKLKKEQVKLQEQSQFIAQRMPDVWEKSHSVLRTIGARIEAIGAAIKGIAVNMAAAFAVTLITSFVTKLIQANKELKEYKKILETSTNEIERATVETKVQIKYAEDQYKIAKDITKKEEERVTAAKTVRKILADSTITLDDILQGSTKVDNKLADWSKQLMKAAKAAALFNKLVELNEKLFDLQQKLTEEQTKPKNPYRAHDAGRLMQGLLGWDEKYQDNGKINRYKEEIKSVEAAMQSLYDTAKKESLINPFVGDDTSVDTAEAIKNALDGYNRSMDELDKKLKKGSISTKKYNRDVNKLREDTLQSIQKYDDWEDVVEGLGTEYEKLVGKLKQTSNYSNKSPLTQLKEDLDDFKKDKSALDNTLAAGKMTGEEYAKALNSLVEKYRDNIFGVDDLAGKLTKLGQKYKDIVEEFNEAINDVNLFNQIDEAIKAQEKALENEMEKSLDKIEKYFEKSAQIMADGIPQKKKKEEGFFAYKDGLHESLGRYAKDSEDYVKQLENLKKKILELKKYSPLDPAMQKMFDEVIERLRVASNEATALRDAANFAEVRKDIQELSQQLASDVWETWADGLAGGASRIASAFESLNEAFDGELFDEELFEKFDKLMKMISSLNEIVETVNSTFQFFNSLLKTNAKYEEALAAMTTITSGVKKKSLAAETVAEVTSAAATESSEAAKTAAIGATTKALAAQAVAGAASSVSWLPIVGPAAAALAIGAVVAAIMAGSKKFAKGGIIGGSKTQGDKETVRVNSGEMILNKQQQANLFSMINRGTKGGDVEFKIRGADLVGAINNYNSRRRG